MQGDILNLREYVARRVPRKAQCPAPYRLAGAVLSVPVAGGPGLRKSRKKGQFSQVSGFGGRVPDVMLGWAVTLERESFLGGWWMGVVAGSVCLSCTVYSYSTK